MTQINKIHLNRRRKEGGGSTGLWQEAGHRAGPRKLRVSHCSHGVYRHKTRCTAHTVCLMTFPSPNNTHGMLKYRLGV